VSLPVRSVLVQPLADSDAGKGSPIGLFVVLLLVVATYLLYRSMAKHLRKLPDRFPGYRPGEPDEGDEPTEPGRITDPAEPAGAAPEAAGAAPEASAGSGNPAAETGERTG